MEPDLQLLLCFSGIQTQLMPGSPVQGKAVYGNREVSKAVPSHVPHSMDR